MKTIKQIEAAIAEARIFGSSFLGDASFDVMKDAPKINKYLREHGIEDVALENDYGEGWYITQI